MHPQLSPMIRMVKSLKITTAGDDQKVKGKAEAFAWNLGKDQAILRVVVDL